MASEPRLSVVIPALNEAPFIEACVVSALQEGASRPEVIVVDGGSEDDTPSLAEKAGASVLEGFRGRAVQMNAGGRAATGSILLFLHADTVLPPGYGPMVGDALSWPGVVGGAFSFRLDAEGPGLRFIEAMANLRSRLLFFPYGDQGLFVKRGLFHEMGGFPDVPIMEDYAFVRRLRRRGRIVTLKAAALTSARRWQRKGVLRTTLINKAVVLGYRLGVSPWRLKRWYGR